MDTTYFQKRYFENEYTEMHIEEEILFIKYKEGVIIDLAAARKLREDRLQFTNRATYSIFVDGRGVKYWTKEAREYQSGKENNEGMKALVMYIDAYAISIIVKFYLLFNKPVVPQACFTNYRDAQKWIEQFK